MGIWLRKPAPIQIAILLWKVLISGYPQQTQSRAAFIWWTTIKLGDKVEERRKENEQHWYDINKFISESREYRAKDEVVQKYQVENIEALKNQVKAQNGRVLELEKWREEIKLRIKNRREEIDSAIQSEKDSWVNVQTLITIITGIIMAVSAVVMILKK
jgi:hypothetical protein